MRRCAGRESPEMRGKPIHNPLLFPPSLLSVGTNAGNDNLDVDGRGGRYVCFSDDFSRLGGGYMIQHLIMLIVAFLGIMCVILARKTHHGCRLLLSSHHHQLS